MPVGRQGLTCAVVREIPNDGNGSICNPPSNPSDYAASVLAHPTRFERVTFAFGGQTPTPPISEQRIYSVARMGCCKPLATTPQRAALLRVTLPGETALWLFHDVDRRRKLKGRA